MPQKHVEPRRLGLGLPPDWLTAIRDITAHTQESPQAFVRRAVRRLVAAERKSLGLPPGRLSAPAGRGRPARRKPE